MSQAQPWYSYPVTQGHGQNGELGIDLGTPQDTPITNLLPGVVTDATYGPWGGDVHVATTGANGQPVFEEFLHLDQILVSAGETLGVGDLVGYSGGQNSGGMHNASPQFSSGPHTEFGLYTSLTANAGTALDPTTFIHDLASGVTALLPSSGGSTTDTTLSSLPPFGTSGATSVGSSVAGIIGGPGSAIGQLFAGLTNWQKVIVALVSGTIWQLAGWGLIFVGLIIFLNSGNVAGDTPANHALRLGTSAAKLAK